MNPACRYYEVARTVPMPQIDDGLYLVETVVCACGLEPWLVS